MTSDVLDHAQRELTERGLDPATVSHALREVRRHWGGAECYILAIDRGERDRKAREALAQGASIVEAARAAGCSVSTVRRRRSNWL